ncbi:MAG: RidA family protein [Deltaproteobacteria bacterium]|nr:RidA family protein [Deltaproteobacteria bacterium]
MNIDKRIARLGLSLPKPAKPVANYLPYKIINLRGPLTPVSGREGLPISSGLLYLSGMIPMQDGKPFRTGKLGDDVSVEDGVTCAQICTLNALGWAKVALDGNLDTIIEIVRVRGFVASTPEFTDQPQVINGCSDMLVEIFGDDGRHVRSAVGSVCLPMNVPVEIDFVFSLR